MPNMAHCRFQNTADDLQECYDNMDGALSSPAELKARERLLLTCRRIADDYEGEIEQIQERRQAARQPG